MPRAQAKGRPIANALIDRRIITVNSRYNRYIHLNAGGECIVRLE